MGIGKGGVDLDGSHVTRHGAIQVSHLFEGVAHVGVGVGERRVDSDRLFVVHQGIVQLRAVNIVKNTTLKKIPTRIGYRIKRDLLSTNA